MRPTVFIDCETDGLHPECQPWEVAMIARVDDMTETVWHWFLPLDLTRADPKALEIGGFWDRHPEGRRLRGLSSEEKVTPREEVAQTILQITYDSTLLGVGVHYDADVLARLLRSVGLMPMWHYRLRDVGSIAMGYYGRDLGGLDGVMARTGVKMEPEARHTAMGDARAAMDIFDKLMWDPTRTEP